MPRTSSPSTGARRRSRKCSWWISTSTSTSVPRTWCRTASCRGERRSRSSRRCPIGIWTFPPSPRTSPPGRRRVSHDRPPHRHQSGLPVQRAGVRDDVLRARDLAHVGGRGQRDEHARDRRARALPRAEDRLHRSGRDVGPLARDAPAQGSRPAGTRRSRSAVAGSGSSTSPVTSTRCPTPAFTRTARCAEAG